MSGPSIRFWNGIAIGIPLGMLLLTMILLLIGVGRPAGRYQVIEEDRLLDSSTGIVFHQTFVDNTGSRYWTPKILK